MRVTICIQILSKTCGYPQLKRNQDCSNSKQIKNRLPKILIKCKTKNNNKYRRIINKKITKKLLVQYPDKTQQHSCQDHLK